MKAEFVEYLNTIGIKAVAYHNRIEAILKVISELYPGEEVVDVFVDEHIKEDGTREYEDISFFGNRYNFGAIRFLTNDEFIFTKKEKKVTFYKIYNKDYDFKKATENSRLNLEVHYETPGLQGNFKASKENCDFLKQIILKYIIPNLK